MTAVKERQWRVVCPYFASVALPGSDAAAAHLTATAHHRRCPGPHVTEFTDLPYGRRVTGKWRP